MKLFWSQQTRSSRAVWMLEEAGVEYEIESVDIRAEDRQDSPEFRAASPMGKVPALIDGDVAMSESAAICLYVADRYCSGELAPAVDDPARGKFLYWIMYTPAVIEPAMTEKVNGIEPNSVRSGWGSFELMLEMLPDSEILGAYADRCLARPAYQKALSLDQTYTV
jgi:glutathione S-transferase